MTEQEAIDDLKQYDDCAGLFVNVKHDTCIVAITALEKQIPKKPIPKYGINNTINSYHCPTCENSYLGGGEYRYDCCEDCGQKLDWSDEDDI